MNRSHHLLHTFELLYEAIDFLNVASRTFDDSSLAAAVEYLWIGSFVWCHRLYDSFDTDKCLVVYVYVFDSLAYSRYHRGEVFEVTHLFYLLYLLVEVVETELVFGYLFRQLAGFFFVVLLLCFLYERYYIAHTEYAVCHTFGVEYVDSIELFAYPYEFDGLVYYAAYRYSRTAAGVAVEFGEHYAVEIQAVVECLGGVYCILPCHSVYDE